MRRWVVLAYLSLTVILTTYGQPAKLPAARPDASSCRKFVQDFYDWYVPIAVAATERMMVSLRPRQSSFNQTLWQMLVTDDEAQSHSNEIVGLEFDPILNSQDPSPHFKVLSVSIAGNDCAASVVGFNQGVREERVMPELVVSNDRWVFQNFYYRNMVRGKWQKSDLIQILKQLQKYRSASDREKAR